jgi:hypothetical protein
MSHRKVTFNECIRVHYVCLNPLWLDAYRSARCNTIVLDRMHFQRRVHFVELQVCKILDPMHRRAIYVERFQI